MPLTKTAISFQRALRAVANPTKADFLQRFFKTKPGEYAAGDRFLGITVPQTRRVCRIYKDLSFTELRQLIRSPYHEDRLGALIILSAQFKGGDERLKKRIFDLYIANRRYINNWDLVDVSAPNIVGVYLTNRPKDMLVTLASSKNLWDRRIAVLATFADIQSGKPDICLKISSILVDDDHDLVQKAVGWMLREVGKRCSMRAEEDFLQKHADHMPRTMLRYAIERFPEEKSTCI